MCGTIATVTPDEILALFGYPKAHEDDAERAVDAVAQSAPMALQRITDAGDRSLILILSDINMPGMSGLELLPKAKAMRPDVPVIMITAYGDVETKRKALENGAEALLTNQPAESNDGSLDHGVHLSVISDVAADCGAL